MKLNTTDVYIHKKTNGFYKILTFGKVQIAGQWRDSVNYQSIYTPKALYSLEHKQNLDRNSRMLKSTNMIDKLILVHYLNVGDSPIADAKMQIELYKHRVINGMSDDIMNIVIPVRNQETKIDCINPKLLPEDKYAETLKLVEKAKEGLAKFLSMK